jgi:hypothetical protein
MWVCEQIGNGKWQVGWMAIVGGDGGLSTVVNEEGPTVNTAEEAYAWVSYLNGGNKPEPKK